MSIRHYLAELQHSGSAKATYRFTPDSITKLYWGVVEFDLGTYSSRVVEEAPDPERWGWPQAAICTYLARKLQQHYAGGATQPPAMLEWVS